MIRIVSDSIRVVQHFCDLYVSAPLLDSVIDGVLSESPCSLCLTNEYIAESLVMQHISSGHSASYTPQRLQTTRNLPI